MEPVACPVLVVPLALGMLDCWNIGFRLAYDCRVPPPWLLLDRPPAPRFTSFLCHYRPGSPCSCTAELEPRRRAERSGVRTACAKHVERVPRRSAALAPVTVAMQM